MSTNAKLHRTINTFILVAIGFLGYLGWNSFKSYTEQEQMETEISRVIEDESFRSCVYSDSLGYATVGFGHLVRQSESFTCITPHEAIQLLREDYSYAKRSVEVTYPWAEGEAKLILINLSYQLGENRLAKFRKMLAAMKAEDYYTAAAELIDSQLFKQTPNRVIRHVARLAALGDQSSE